MSRLYSNYQLPSLVCLLIIFLASNVFAIVDLKLVSPWFFQFKSFSLTTLGVILITNIAYIDIYN